MERWTCPLCRQTFTGSHRSSAHMRNMWKSSTDTSRCDWARHVIPLVPQVAAQIPQVPLQPALQTAVQEAVIPPRVPLHQLSRRAPFNSSEALLLRSTYCIEDVSEILDNTGRSNFLPVQDAWDSMLAEVKQKCSKQFWVFFLKLHSFSSVVVDTALKGVKSMFLTKQEQKGFPASRRQMMSRLTSISSFWRVVRHTCRIDLSDFDLGSGTKYLQFDFIDPVWGWLLAARRQNPADLHWRPVAQHRSNAVYGGGIQYGECFRHAYRECPEGGDLMLITLHWDGTFGRSLDVTPIAVGVANNNNCDTSKEFCIGYMPFTSDQKKPEFAKTQKCTRCVHVPPRFSLTICQSISRAGQFWMYFGSLDVCAVLALHFVDVLW